jgi:hypothetical protein
MSLCSYILLVITEETLGTGNKYLLSHELFSFISWYTCHSILYFAYNWEL